MRRNLYDLLGVRPDDDAENVRKAYRRAAKENHPDHHGDDPEAAARFRQIAEAYDVLRDAGQRAAYDRLLETERARLRSTLKGALAEVKRHMVTDVIIGVILAAVLAGGYELYFRASETATDDDAGVTAQHAVPELAAAQPAAPGGGATGRYEPAGTASTMPVEHPAVPGGTASAGQTISVAGGDRGSDLPADRAGAAAPGQAAKDRGDEPQDRHEMLSAAVPVPVADTADGIPGQSSPGVAALADTPDSRPAEIAGASTGVVKVPSAVAPVAAAGTANGVTGPPSSGVAAMADKSDSLTPETASAGTGPARQQAETRMSGLRHAEMKRPHASRVSFRHATLAHRRVLARMDWQYCETPTLVGAGY
jgi:curved DNA-binding protein CbpA